MILLFAASFIGYCILYMALDLYDSSEVPLIVCVQIIIVSYLVSLFGKINIISDILFYGGFIALAAGLYLKRKDLKGLASKLLSPAFIFFLIFCIGLYKLCGPVVCVYPDEIAHYGLLPRYMLFSDKIPGVNSVVELINYPPGTALLQYYTARFTNNKEGMVFFGQMILYASLMTIVWKNISWKKFWLGLLSVTVAIVVLFKFREYNFISLYTDQIAAMSGFFIAASYLRSEKKPKDILKLLPVVFFTPLIRESGISFAVFGSSLILVYSSFSKNHNGNENPDGNGGFRTWLYKHYTALSAVLLIVTAFLSYKIWNLHVDTFQIATYRGYLTLPSIISGFMKFLVAIYDVANNFMQVSIVDSPGGWAFITTPAGAMLLFICLSLLTNILLKSIGRDDKHIRATLIAVFAELIIYTVGLAFTYSYTFRDAEYLAAFPRYMGGITVYCGLVVTFIFINALDKLKKDTLQFSIARSVAIVFILMMFIATYPVKYNLYVSRNVTSPQQTAMDEKTAGIRSILQPDDKVYQIWQAAFDQTYYFARYSLMVQTNTWGWIIGTPYGEGDLYTCQYTVDEWASQLIDDHYDYVFLGATNQELWDVYGELFNIVDDPDVNVYRVTPDDEYLLTAWDTETNSPYIQ